MPRHVLDHDPLTGITTYFDYERGVTGDRVHLTHVQPVDSIIDQAKTLANDADYTREGIRNDMWHYARIPLNVFLEIEQKYGVKCVSKIDDIKSFMRILNAHYPHLKTTHKTHA
jgi:hypothetical protein